MNTSEQTLACAAAKAVPGKSYTCLADALIDGQDPAVLLAQGIRAALTKAIEAGSIPPAIQAEALTLEPLVDAALRVSRTRGDLSALAAMLTT